MVHDAIAYAPTNDNLSIRGARFSEKNGHLENIYGLRVTILTLLTLCLALAYS